MNKNIDNPWKSIQPFERLRVDDKKRVVECYWFVNTDGKYGYLLETPNEEIDVRTTINLKGIQIVVNPSEGYSRLMLILDSKDDWELFLALCKDLTAASNNMSTVEGFLASIQTRLNRWQSLLRVSKSLEMSKQIQMGLFTELSFLFNNLIPKLGVKQSIISWVGPDSDKQDFLIENAVIEVKSYRTSKGPKVSISSLDQLYSEKEPLYLVAYALSTGESGLTVSDLVNFIESEITPKDENLFDLFSGKLMNYGYVPESPDSTLLKFVIDKEKYYSISEGFPRIILDDVPKAIANIRYSINLSECEDFLIDKKDFI